MFDPFADADDSVGSPARAPFAITPSDTAALPICPKAIYVGVGGTLVLRGVDAAADVTLANVPAGFIIDIRASYVRATGTSAAGLVALA
jgi:hypothetical protein